MIMEIKDNANATALEFTKGRLAAGKDASPSIGLVHSLLMTTVVLEVINSLVRQPDETDEVFEARTFQSLAYALNEVENGSALRQKYEKDKVLPKLGKAAGLAAEFANA